MEQNLTLIRSVPCDIEKKKQVALSRLKGNFYPQQSRENRDEDSLQFYAALDKIDATYTREQTLAMFCRTGMYNEDGTLKDEFK